MSWFNQLFGRKATNSYMPAAAASTPPQPEGAWQIIVDEHGDKVTNRAPLPTDFVARPSAITDFDGRTFPIYEPDKSRDRHENNQAYIEWSLRNQRNREHLEKAIFLLSQTDDGRRLLLKAKEKGFAIVFDPDQCAEEKALGLCDYANKRIPLAEGRSPAEVALTLKHELQHMEDIENGMGENSTMTPRDAILSNRALESNARVSEGVAAAQALLGSPTGPEQQFRTIALFEKYWQKNTPMAQAAHDALGDAAAGKWTSFAAKVFPSYWQQERTLEYYDARYAKYIGEKAPDIQDSLDFIANPQRHDLRLKRQHENWIAWSKQNIQTLFTREINALESIPGKLTIRGQAYGAEIDPKIFSLADDKAHALTRGSAEAYAKLRQNLDFLDESGQKSALLDLPLRPPSGSPAAAPSPYAPTEQKGESTFSIISIPTRIEGARMAGAQTENSYTTEIMQKLVNERQDGACSLDRIHHAATEYFAKNASSHNMRGKGGALLEAGLLAPIAAFPDSYVNDLYRRVSLSAEIKPGKHPDVDPKELKLIAHWQELRDRGLDPIFGDADTKKKSFMQYDQETIFWAQQLVDSLPAAKSSAGPAKTPAAALQASM